MSESIPSRCDWFSKNTEKYFSNKKKIIDDYMKLFFSRTNEMFEYDGLPETIPKRDYLLIKQTFGSATLTKVNDKPYAFYGALGNILNEYYHPTHSIVTNPYLKFNKDMIIGKDCVVIKNDLFYNGLYRINLKYATLLAECDITIRKCLLNVRIDNVVESQDDRQDASIKQFFEDVENGNFGFISSKKLLEKGLLQIHAVASTSNNPLKDLIEMRNYIESCWWMEFGLNANYNMKRESLTDAETNVDDKTMIPFIDQMLECEIDGWNEFNKMYGYNVKVKLSPLWKKVKDDVLTKSQANDENNEDVKDGDNDDTREDESNQ